MTATARPGQSARDTELVLAFLNTIDVERQADVLERADGWQRWAHEHGGGQRIDEAGAARDVRQGLRAAITGDEPVTLAGPALRVELAGGEPSLAGDTVVGAVLAAAARLAATGEWARLKICPADTCRWAFHDDSRNRSRTWCSMRVCGNRAKARAWRARNQ